MKIAIIDTDWRGHNATYDSLLIQYFLDQGHEILFLTSSDNNRVQIKDSNHNYTRISLPFGSSETDEGRYIKMALDQAKKVVQMIYTIKHIEDEIDILYYPDIDHLEFPILFSSLIHRINTPSVATIHRDHYNRINQKSILHRVYDLVTKNSLNKLIENRDLSHIIVHSPEIKSRLESSVDNIDGDIISVLPAPTPSPPGDLAKKEARKKLNIPIDEPILLFFGGLRYEKGPDILIEALKSIEKNITAIFAGPAGRYDSEDAKSWQDMTASNINIIDRVEFIDEQDVYKYFISSDIVVLPYRRKKGISGPLRRACITGTPVIGREGSDVGSIIKQHNIGTTFELGSLDSLTESILNLLNNETPSGVSSYGEEVKWNKVGEQHISLFKRVIDNEIRN